ISGKDVLKKLVKKNVFNGCSLLIPKKVFDEVGLFNEKYKYIQDWDMWFRIALGGYYFAKVDSPLVKMRIHPNQQTLKLIKYRDEELNDSIISNVKNMLSINNKSLLI